VNFGTIDVVWPSTAGSNSPSLELAIRDAEGRPVESQSLALSDLRVGKRP
jgi:hypothetical protein